MQYSKLFSRPILLLLARLDHGFIGATCMHVPLCLTSEIIGELITNLKPASVKYMDGSIGRTFLQAKLILHHNRSRAHTFAPLSKYYKYDMMHYLPSIVA